MVVRAVAQATCEQLREDLSAALEDPLQGSRQVPRLLQEAIDRLHDEGDDGREAEDCVTLALEMLLEVKAFQEAVKLYLDWNREVQIPISSRVEMLKILGTYGNFQPAANHVRELLEAEDIGATEAAELFDGILFGIVQAHHPLSSSRADVLIKEMLDIGLQPTDETMRLIVEAKTLFAAPGFLIDLGQSVLEVIRRCDTALKSSSLLAISGAHLRTGDLDAAYRWFLASQLMTDRQTLNDGPTLELVSQLARALAIGGRACQLKRLLERLKEDGGSKLPLNAAAVSLSGYTCGRSMATCWLEPAAEVLRRRGLWSSSPAQRQGAGAARVTCSEQWDWQQQETSRQEMYQWYPYMSPETKLERAWMTPLRSIDQGALGLAGQWAGQTPAEASARERLQESTGSQAFDLEAALSLEPPRRASRGKVLGSPVVLRPEPKTWRMYHADAVKRAYPTALRTSVGSPEELRELLLAEKKTREMFGAKPVAHPIPYSTIEAWVDEADQATLAKLKTKDLENMTKEQLIDNIAAISGMSPEDIEENPKLNLSRLRHIQQTAVGFATGKASVPLTDEEYTEKILAMTDDELQEAFLSLKSSINDSIMGSDLSQQVESKLLQERDEDGRWDGSAADELRLALDICEALQDMGFTRSTADQRALLSAAHALGDAALAAEVLSMQDLQDVAGHASASSSLGPAQESLWRAMVQGGWDPETTKDFLQGKRLIPLRDGHSELGKLQTKYLDPLQGLASATGASPDDLLAKLTKPFSGRLKPFTARKLQSGADAQSREDRMNIIKEDENSALSSVQWEMKVPDPEDPTSKVTKLVQVTRSDVLKAQLLHPSICDLLLRLSSSPQLSKSARSSTAEVGKMLMEIGLPVPARQDKKQELLSFVVSVLRSSSKTAMML